MTDGTPIELVAYSPAWPLRFDAERTALAAIFPPDFRIDHIGSTAVPGLAAKPIIDILIGAPALAQVESRIAAMQASGYRYRPEFEAELPLRRYFVKPADSPQEFHVHAVATDGEFWTAHLLFRDALCADLALAAEYAALKRALAARHRGDRDSYTAAKAPFIRATVEHAMARQKLSTGPR